MHRELWDFLNTRAYRSAHKQYTCPYGKLVNWFKAIIWGGGGKCLLQSTRDIHSISLVCFRLLHANIQLENAYREIQTTIIAMII